MANTPRGTLGRPTGFGNPLRLEASIPRLRTAPTTGAAPNPNRSRRIKTENLPVDPDVPPTLPALRTKVYDEVIDRMRAANIKLKGISMDSLDFLLPVEVEHAEIWNRLLAFPMLVSDIELRDVLDLQPSTATTPDPTPGSKLYYIRSFGVTVHQLLAICEQWQKQGLEYEEMKYWMKMTEFVPDKNQTVYIRYAGMSGAVSAFRRFQDDLMSRNDGVYGNFVKTIMELDPTILDNIRVYTFPRGATRALRDQNNVIIPLDPFIADTPEQAVIALFGRQTLLNRQPGGFHTSFQPLEEDMAQFQKLRTAFFRKLNNLTVNGSYQTPDEDTRYDVNKWMLSVKQFGQKHAADLGTDKIPMTDIVEQTWAEQATPGHFFDHFVLCAFVGDYPPLEVLFSPEVFWKIPCRSVRYLKSILASLKALEEGKETWDPSDITRIATSGIFPWVDYQYTPKRKLHLEPAAELLRQYFDTTKPLIGITFERRTSGVVRANWVSLYSGHDFYDQAGIPAIQYWTHPGEVTNRGNRFMKAENEPQPEDAFIQIPLYHTGHDKYTAGELPIRRMTFINSWQIVLMLEVAIDYLSCGIDPNSISRYDMCESILAEFNNRWQASGCDKVFEQARKDLISHFDVTQRGRWGKDSNRLYRSHVDGQTVAVNSMGIMTIYWERPDGSGTRVIINVGRGSEICVPSDAEGNDAIRTLHFTDKGLDVRDGHGNSKTFKFHFSAPTSSPTLPGWVLIRKMMDDGMGEFKDLWKSQTGRDFDADFPDDGSCMKCSWMEIQCDGVQPRCGPCKKAKIRTCSFWDPVKRQKEKDLAAQKATGKSSAAPATPGPSTKPGASTKATSSSSVVPAKRPPPPKSTTPGAGAGTGAGTGRLRRRMAKGGPNTPAHDNDDDADLGTASASGPGNTSKSPTKSKGRGKAKATDDGTPAGQPPVPGKKRTTTAGEGGKSGSSNISSIKNKCQGCRLAGVACFGSDPCAQCSLKGIPCVKAD